ncbi:hypothetical protein [Bacterioplanoides sp.]|uniref:hypothetical protein n=1 Tax=Bacterioplanoides sp. TaxID=2066072 RepID=UPI003B003E49
MAKTIRMMGMMQENGLSKQEMLLLEANAKALYKKHFGNKYRIMPIWVVIPRGQAFLAAQASTSTTVTLPVDDGTDDKLRHAFMSEFCEMWMGVTQCHINEIILTVPDMSVSDGMVTAQLERINPSIKKLQMARMLLKMFKSKLVHGYFSMNMNLNQ